MEKVNSKELNNISQQYIMLDETTGEIHPVTNKEALQVLHRDKLVQNKVNQREGLKKKDNEDDFKKYIDSHYGSFYFNFYDLLHKQNLRPQDQFRFIYLCTYANYENILMKNNKTKLTRKDFDEILGLSRMETHRTLDDLKEKRLLIEEGGVFMVNKKICVRGNLSTKEKSEEFARIFDEGIRELYEQASPKEHKLLNVFIQLLPYVNYEYNMVCKNPKETNKDLIEPLRVKEMAEILGYSKPSRLKSDLLKIKVGDTYAITLFVNGLGMSIVINPKFFYKGNKKESLEIVEIGFNKRKEQEK